MVKFYEQSITTGCRQGLLYLKSLLFIQDFYLAGGTALALQIGHRISTDLDWFSASHFLEKEEREQILKRLASSGRLEVTSEQDGMLFTRIFGTDVSFIYQHHALLTRTVEYENIQLVDCQT